jgi:hypothetical protein
MKNQFLSTLPSKTRLLGLALLLGAITALYACGGGGGGDAPAPAPAPPPPAPKFWSGAVPISVNSNLFPQTPQTAMDANGNAMAVWQQNDTANGTSSIWANRYSASTGKWDVAGPLENLAGNASDPQVALDANGNAVAVWSQVVDSTFRRIYAQRYVVGSGWGTALPIDAARLYGSSPRIAMDAAGNALVVWEQLSGLAQGDQRTVWANRLASASGVWSGALQIYSGSETAFAPQIAVDASGTAIAVWSQRPITTDNSGVVSIGSNRFNGTAWGTAEPVETDTAFTQQPSIAMDGKGNATAVWMQNDGTQYNLWANRYNNTSHTWGRAAPAHKGVSSNSHTPQVALDSAGNAIMVWHSQQLTGNFVGTVFASRMDAGTGAWGAPAQLGQREIQQRFIEPQIAIEANGNAMAVWSYRDGNGYRAYYSRYSAGSWGSATLLEPDGIAQGSAESMRIAMNASGAAMAVWTHYDSGASQIFANAYR